MIMTGEGSGLNFSSSPQHFYFLVYGVNDNLAVSKHSIYRIVYELSAGYVMVHDQASSQS